ncbi:MAG TPA: carbon-nitrogen hydrolase family protein [Chryseosolibacter sp.]|nr:carbon-nitrogen hydrolase family protein [Chryseosolibacter sp.]
MTHSTRRDFIKHASLGAAALSVPNFVAAAPPEVTSRPANRREVWIATVTQYGIEGNDLDSTLKAALRQMENVVPFSPHIVCLPEAFPTAGIRGPKPPMNESAENGSGNIIGPFQDFAKKHSCYVICPVYIADHGKYYNAAVVINPLGKRIGEYRKIRLTTGECQQLVPGLRNDIPVFETPFGKFGIQICFDVEWPDGWRTLGEKGADIVFWPSAFAGGKMLNAFAFQNHYHVVTSTRKGTSKICDLTGDVLAASGGYSPWGVCAPVNLEKAFLHSWPYNKHFPAIEKKYGRDVRITTLHEEEFTIIESLSDDIKVADILKEFDLKTHREHLRLAEGAQDKFYHEIQ